MKRIVPSRIASKISRKMLTIYIAIYLVLLVLLLIFLVPFLCHSTIVQTQQTLDSMTTEYDNLRQNIEETISRYYLASDLENALSNYSRNPTESNHTKITLLLGEISSSNSRLLSTCMEDTDGNFFSSWSHSKVDKQALLHSYPSYRKLLEYQYSSFFSPLITDTFSDSSGSCDCFAYSQNLFLNSRPYVVTVFYNASTFRKQFNALASLSFTEFSILNYYKEVLYQSDASFSYEQIFEKLRQTKQSSGYFSHKRGMIFYDTAPSSACTILAYVPYLRLFSSSIFIICIITLLYALSPILYGLLLNPEISRQLAPLKKLSDTMEHYTAGDPVQVDFNTQDEIQAIGDSFNEMVCAINQKILEIQEREHQNAITSYKLLATQIDPHFIYNTMNIINIMAKEGKADEVVEINCALIKILRERLNSKISIFETVQNEIDTLMQYCTIINHRYQNQILVHFDVDQALYGKWIPKNILQPLVENSFYHAFSDTGKARSGHINILIYSIEKEMTIEVSDDGNGMTENRIETILKDSKNIYHDKKPHIGINNIRQRLSYLYQENYTFLIQSSQGHGTTIIITIPEIDEQPELTGL